MCQRCEELEFELKELHASLLAPMPKAGFTPTEHVIYCALAKMPGKPVHRDTLLALTQHLTRDGYGSDASIRTAICRLRHKLPTGKISALHGFGYVFKEEK